MSPVKFKCHWCTYLYNYFWSKNATTVTNKTIVSVQLHLLFFTIASYLVERVISDTFLSQVFHVLVNILLRSGACATRMTSLVVTDIHRLKTWFCDFGGVSGLHTMRWSHVQPDIIKGTQQQPATSLIPIVQEVPAQQDFCELQCECRSRFTGTNGTYLSQQKYWFHWATSKKGHHNEVSILSSIQAIQRGWIRLED